MKVLSLTSASLLYLIAFFSCNRPSTPLTTNLVRGESLTQPDTITQLDQNSPEAHYAEFCASCHGSTMEAFVDRKWKYGSSRDEIIKSIAMGITKAGMPSYDTTFTAVQLSSLADYIMKGISDRASYDPVSKVTPQYYTTEKMTLEVDTVVGGLEVPWGIKVTTDGTVYFTERKGTFKVQYPDNSLVEIKNVPTALSFGQGGMMDVALHPDHESNGWIYLSYTKAGENDTKTTAVARGRINSGSWVDHEDIFEAVPYVDTRYHFGSRLIFDKQNYLYVTVGDRGKRDDHPQFLTNSCGKVHRLRDDGSIPEDNPFYDQTEAIKSIWSYGHRNQQGMVYDKKHDRIWTHEHGPRGGDELNLIQPAQNYGWPIISYGINYNGTTFTNLTAKKGMIAPTKYWIPSIAPSGMAIVEGNRYPGWEGDILSGSLRFNYLSRISLDDHMTVTEERILKDIGRVRAIEMGADGYLYIGVEEPGRILRVKLKK